MTVLRQTFSVFGTDWIARMDGDDVVGLLVGAHWQPMSNFIHLILILGIDVGLVVGVICTPYDKSDESDHFTTGKLSAP